MSITTANQGNTDMDMITQLSGISFSLFDD